MDDKMFGMLIRMDERLDEITKTLERNTVSLEIHEKRTSLNEERIQKLEEQALFIQYLVKIFTGVVALSGGILTIIQLIRFFSLNQ